MNIIAETPTSLPHSPVPTQDDRRIELHDIVKCYDTKFGEKRVLDGITFGVGPGEKIAVLGKNGAGKSTLVKIIGGVEQPTEGTVTRGMTMSWPLSFGGGGFARAMSGLDNIRFIARVYDKPIQETIDFVEDFAELGSYLKHPVKAYSSGMAMRLAFALTLAVDFDCLLIDEVIAVGDQRFAKKCREALFERRKHCSMILVSHAKDIIKTYCDRALVLKNGRGRVFDDIDFALEIYSTL
ncbi:ABC transporter ATP-binding protein [Lutibaculum baratangense]|uniref:Capsular polysaccharide ABC transporter, ATP-binding protein KpsT n=1 Tax=Lutibaculum baratangense AMV1 TaxID=631454 RepID=V4QS82_9HYPH|nr:ABC transporter ATP-binding protein [Lutibaculum baratangense]ESR22632.1 Capsular polysaccharide ABC transporter, ATP-binding protein KpsT [Lutibaculum baratangense AMV1]